MTPTPNHRPKEKYPHVGRTLIVALVRYWWLWLVVAALVAVAVVVRTVSEHPPVTLEVKRDTRIDVTPEEVRSIRDIGQWEFMSVTTEELVEWNRSRTFGTDRLVRIYTGTLRLGVDMKKCNDDWFTSLPDSVAALKLPPVELLDSNFIDEARTRSFYEKGSFPPQAADELYRKARTQMIERCLTAQNLQTAERNARERISQVFRAMGFKRVDITFEASPQAK